MKAGNYDISLDQGSTFNFHITYMDASDVGITLDTYQTTMHVRRSFKSDQLILSMSGNTASTSVTGGGSTGEFTAGVSAASGGGSAGTGGIFLDVNTNGISGTTGSTGGILIKIDSDTMQNVPYGRHFYDIEITDLSKTPNEVNRILKGAFEVDAEVTR